MKILVCAKQVIDPESVLEVTNAYPWVEPAHAPRYGMNQFDEYAVEEAVRIKESTPNVSVDVLTVGPDRAAAVLERARGMGCDRGIHVVADDDAWIPPEIVANWIAAVAREKTYDLILTGVMSEDAMQGATGPMIAESLSLPYAVGVVSVAPEDDAVRLERELAGGRREILRIPLPAVLCLQSGINEPRYPKLSALLKAKKTPPQSIPAETLTLISHRQRIIGGEFPTRSRDGMMLDGNAEDKAVKLLDLLEEKSLLKKRAS